jgi:magnesium chelatase family protein
VLAHLHSFATVGLKSVPVTVEVDIAPGLNSFSIVGLGDTAVQESKERVRSAIKNTGFPFPRGKKITVNLVPADLKKVGSRYDLPIALGILMANGDLDLPLRELHGTIILGELALDGALRHVPGVISHAIATKERGATRLVVPAANGPEAALVPGIRVLAPESLRQLINILTGETPLAPPDRPAVAMEVSLKPEIDFSSIRGQAHAKRAMEIAAAGGHNVLMSGAPGAGKTLLAKALAGIIPPLSLEEALEITQIYSIADQLPEGTPLVTSRPFRAVHHTASGVSIVGGGQIPGPGEITLAHRGVLFLDELVEFPPSVLEVLRQPMEDKRITVTRTQGSVTFPADFMLVAAMNPPEWSASTRRAQRRLSPPLLDRIDLTVDVQPVEVMDLERRGKWGETSAEILQRVIVARERQKERFKGMNINTNAEMNVEELDALCPLNEESQLLLRQATSRLGLSARGYHRTIKVARTIADLAGSEELKGEHIAEALQYRQQVGVEV